jgi:hypothetical protein
MALRRRPWVAAALVLLAACSGGAPDLVMRPTAPEGGSSALRRGARTAPTLAGLPASPWGTVPVSAPARLRSTADAYYEGAGPLPDQDERGRPACLLLLPTVLGPTVEATPSSRFDVFGHFVVTWALVDGHGTALKLEVVPPGDPTDQRYFETSAQVTTFADGSQLRTAPRQPRSVLIRMPVENCEYELDPAAGLPPSRDAPILSSLRLIYAP